MDVTREQAKCTTWNIHRAGCIPATNFRKWFTVGTHESKSLKILYNIKIKISLYQQLYGDRMEDGGCQDFEAEMKNKKLAEDIKCQLCPDCSEHFRYSCVNIPRFSQKWKHGF